MKNLDYWEYDRLSVTVKKEKAEELTARYALFQWEEIERAEDKQYDDLLHITFRRKHKISNKDRIQFLQVGLEKNLNELNHLEETKHAKSTVLGLITGMVGLGVAAGSIILAVRYFSVLTVISGVIGTLFGLATAILCGLCVMKVRKREEEVYSAKASKLKKEIESVCSEAQSLQENGV